MPSPFWINNPNVLLHHEKISQIWPSPEMTFHEKLNAITRLVILVTILGMFVGNTVYIGVTGLITVCCIVLLYFFKKNKEGFLSKKRLAINSTNYTLPSDKNPIMNVLPTERKDNPDRKEAAPSYEKEVEEKINKDTTDFIANNFDDPSIKDRLFKDLGDNFNFDRSMRQWYSTANTQIPNDQGAFADWCYGDMISCKEGHELACVRSAPHRLAGS